MNICINILLYQVYTELKQYHRLRFLLVSCAVAANLELNSAQDNPKMSSIRLLGTLFLFDRLLVIPS